MKKKKDELLKHRHPIKDKKLPGLRFRISEVDQICSYCDKPIRAGKPFLSFEYSIKVHVLCIEKMTAHINKFCKKHMKHCVLGAL